MPSLLFTLLQYLQYLFRAQNAHDLHSPFLFELYQKVINKRPDEKEKKLREIRRHLLRQQNLISYTDPKTGIGKRTSIHKLGKRTTSSHRFSTFLLNLINYLGYDSVMETGTALGINTCYLAHSNATKVVTIEGSTELAHLARSHFKSLKLDKIVLVEGKVQDVFSNTLNDYQPELIFLDADHRSETIDFYLKELNQCSSVKCIIVHDIYWSPDMLAAWERSKSDSRYTLTIDIFQAGIIFPNYPMEKQHFSLKF